MNPIPLSRNIVLATLAAATLAFGLPAAVHAQTNTPVMGSLIKIGASNTVDPNSGAVGTGNTVEPNYPSFAIGNANNVTGGSSLAVGNANTVASWYSTVSGGSNVVSGLYNAVFGLSNNLSGGSHSILSGDLLSLNGPSRSSAMFGSMLNGNNINACLSSGSNNYFYDSTDSAVLGRGLIAKGATSCIVVGRYNIDILMSPGSLADPLFVVGNGTGLGNPPTRSNALVVYGDGKVIIPKRQGDISMGEFGNP